MPLLFKMQKTLVTFSLTVILKVRILDIPKLSRNTKGYLMSQNFWGMWRDKWKKIHMWTVWLLACSWAFFSPLNTWKKDKVQVPQQNEMLSSYCTALGFVSKNEEYKLENNV